LPARARRPPSRQDGDATLYVHPGLGTTGPPMRLGVAPAIALVTLRAA
jgi:predicted MPP superfamily phosphohydrolase